MIRSSYTSTRGGCVRSFSVDVSFNDTQFSAAPVVLLEEYRNYIVLHAKQAGPQSPAL